MIPHHSTPIKIIRKCQKTESLCLIESEKIEMLEKILEKRIGKSELI